MPKRSAQDPIEESSNGAKKTRIIRADHTNDCNDPDCKGCDIGDVEINFVNGQGKETQPAAADLLQMAMDELNGNMDMAQRLFDMALDKYSKEEPDNHLGYATCLAELGRGLDVEESLRESLDLYRKESNVPPAMLSRAALSLASLVRKQKNSEMDELDDQDSDDDEAVMRDREIRSKVTKEESKLATEAIDAFKKATQSTESKDQHTLQPLVLDLYTYAQQFNDPWHANHTLPILDTAVDAIQGMPWNEDEHLHRIWAACLLHRYQFVDTSMKAKLCKQAADLLAKAEVLHNYKHNNESAWGSELLAILYMNESNLAQDEDDILSKYDKAVAAYKKAAQLDPSNTKLREMVDMLEDAS